MNDSIIDSEVMGGESSDLGNLDAREHGQIKISSGPLLASQATASNGEITPNMASMN